MKKPKFKVGDLVQLSAAGKKIDTNWMIARRGGFGLVVKVTDKGDQWPIHCHWPKNGRAKKDHVFKEYELKKLKIKK